MMGLESEGITLNKLKEEKRLPLPVNYTPWNDMKFSTPSGKFEFTSELGSIKGFVGKPQYLFPVESGHTNPGLAEKYPYQLLSIHPLRSNHSQHYVLIEAMQSVKIEVSEDIALEKQLAEGDKVRIHNSRGELNGTVKIMKKAHPKTINVDEGLWHKFGGSVNLLTPDLVSDNGQGSTLYDCLVGLEKIE